MTTYTTVAEDAKAIRTALKAKGWTSRDVSVKSEQFSGGSAIRVRVRNPAVPLGVVEAIANAHERISRCQITGEILSGGNRYVDTKYGDEARAAFGARYIDAVNAAIARKIEDGRRGTLIPIAGTFFLIGDGDWSGTYALWTTAGKVARYCGGAQDVAEAVGMIGTE